MSEGLAALVQLGRELRLRPAKPRDREYRLGDCYLAAGQRADLYEALIVMAALDEMAAPMGSDLAAHLHDEAGHLEDCAAEARLAWEAWRQMQPAEAA